MLRLVRAGCGWRWGSARRPLLCATPPRRATSTALFPPVYQEDEAAAAEEEAGAATSTEALRPRVERCLDATVKVYAVAAAPNYLQPWSVKTQRESIGSGFALAADDNDDAAAAAAAW